MRYFIQKRALAFAVMTKALTSLSASGNKEEPPPPDLHGAVVAERVVEKEVERINPPPLYRVLLLNDDYTPMEFVVLVLVKFFHISEERAIPLMLQVHNEGRAVCGIYPKDIAQTKVECVRRFAREHEHPLSCEWEENI